MVRTSDMTKKFKLEDKEYEIDQLSEDGKLKLKALVFSVERIKELNNLQALLQRAKNSYVISLKKEMISDKAGFLFGDN